MRSADRTLIMGVVNVTPDSFSDGGAYLDPGAAVGHAERLVADGADIIDVGAESSRPGATQVSEADEWRRLEPVLGRLARAGLKAALSVDTRKPALMLRAAELGVTYINDVAGAAPAPVLSRLAAYGGLSYVAMHMHGEPETMQTAPLAAQAAVFAVTDAFDDRHRALLAAGFAEARIWHDPGLGFGKTDGGNVALMRQIPVWSRRYQVAVGISRKGLIGRLLGLPAAAERDAPSKMLELGLALLGARLVRTHDVRRLKPALDLLHEGD